jgi:hypothetical protein
LGLSGVSCLPSGLCVVVGTFFSNCTYYHGAVTSCQYTPVLATSTHPTGGSAWTVNYGGPGMSGVSCLSASRCIGFAGAIVTSTDPTAGPTAWHVVSRGNSSYTSVSCPSAAECVAVGAFGLGPDGNARANLATTLAPFGGPWSVAQLASTAHYPSAVSCPSASLCVAFDTSGNVLTSTRPQAGASEWHLVHIGEAGALHALNALSCPSPRLCVAVDGGGNVFASTNPAGGAEAWTETSVLHVKANGSPPGLDEVSCPSARLCLAIDPSAKLLFSTHPTAGASGWKAIRDTRARYVTALSCPSVSLCVAVDDAGNLLTSTIPPAGRARGGFGPSWLTTRR